MIRRRIGTRFCMLTVIVKTLKCACVKDELRVKRERLKGEEIKVGDQILKEFGGILVT